MVQTNKKVVIFCLPNYYGSYKAKGAIKCPEINPNISVQSIFDKHSDSTGKKKFLQQTVLREFPGGPVAGTLCFHCCGPKVQSLVKQLGSDQNKTKQIKTTTKN